jgi:biotin synthase-related radical SAM superfamily protein
VPVFGRGQVSTYILAGLGDSKEIILATSERLIALGVYPFVVPFVPISGTPLESHPAPTPTFMHEILGPLARLVRAGGLSASEIKAGCGKCGACSALSTYEREARA